MCIYHLCVLCTCVAYIYIYGMCMYKPEIDVGLFLYHSLPYSPGQFLSLHLERPNLTGIADQQTPKTLLPLLPQRYDYRHAIPGFLHRQALQIRIQALKLAQQTLPPQSLLYVRKRSAILKCVTSPSLHCWRQDLTKLSRSAMKS